MSVFQTYVNAMNDKIKKQIAISNPFVFKHISNLKSIDQFDDIGPSVVMASPGMMQSGLSRELFEQWCTDRRNGVIIAGYCVEGTLAKNLMTEPEEITTMSGQKIQRKCSVDYISFSAHTDFEQTSEFIRAVTPQNIILVHGEKNEMGRLKAALIREYEDNPELSIVVHNPPNCQSVELYFRGEKMAKVMGQMARARPEHGQQLSGILIKRGFNYHLIAPDDLQNYTELATSILTQKQSVAFHGVFSVLKQCLENLAGRVDELAVHGKDAVRVFGAITVIPDKESVLIEWTANSVNDMYADAVLAVILQVESNPMAAQAASQLKKIDVNTFHEKLITLLGRTYGDEEVVLSALGDEITVHFDGHKAVINLDTLDVECGDESLNHHVSNVVKRLHSAFTPCYA
ncbi:hypothetical protein QZH41_018736 [Actinostola sp. cb2023]|nr:hypothetical protein QZH41_018736 [Actinostola sp. cb2023]